MTILILAFTDLARDPRIRRQIAFLKEHHRILTVACGASEDVDAVHVSLEPWMRRHGGLIRRGVRAIGRWTGLINLTHACDGRLTTELNDLAHQPIDLIIANDVETMQLASAIVRPRNIPILLDAHEMEPWHRRPLPAGRKTPPAHQKWFCNTFIPRARRMVTVSESIAAHYAQTYGVPCDVITNAPFFVAQAPRQVRPDEIRLVHHGGTNASRNLENMFELMGQLDPRYSLDLYLVPNKPDVYERLRRLAMTHPRVRLLPPIPTAEITVRLNAYDLGIYMLNPGVLNQKWSLPNKLFEFVQARLGVAIWPSPEMARIVEQYGLGIIARDFSVTTMAQALNALRPEDINLFKQASHTAARALSAEINRERMLRIVDESLTVPAPGTHPARPCSAKDLSIASPPTP